jgi:hypothetical protein
LIMIQRLQRWARTRRQAVHHYGAKCPSTKTPKMLPRRSSIQGACQGRSGFFEQGAVPPTGLSQNYNRQHQRQQQAVLSTGLSHYNSRYQQQRLLRAGDVERNPGPVAYPCSMCAKGVGSPSVECSQCNMWVHLRCSGLKSYKARTEAWKCDNCLDPTNFPLRRACGPPVAPVTAAAPSSKVPEPRTTWAPHAQPTPANRTPPSRTEGERRRSPSIATERERSERESY